LNALPASQAYVYPQRKETLGRLTTLYVAR
jgi:hypothetical protein